MELGVPWRLILCFISMLCLFIVSLVLVSYIPFSFIVYCYLVFIWLSDVMKVPKRLLVEYEERLVLLHPPKPEKWLWAL